MQLFVNDVIGKKSPLLSLMAFLLFISMPLHSLAFDKFFKLEKFHNWNIILEQNQFTKQNICHAILKPYRTSKFQGEIKSPTFIISYKQPHGYTISFSALADLDVKNGVILKMQNSESVLKTTKYHRNAITYSPAQDVSIIDSLIYGPDVFKIYATTQNGDFNSYYFYYAGLIDALLYMEKACHIHGNMKKINRK